MARTLNQIYNEAKAEVSKRLELTEIQNSSKMSVLDAFTWVASVGVYSVETLFDVFKADVAMDLRNRVNGTAGYYANALLKYQSGDTLEMSSDGTQFSYPTVDESKRIITKVSYSESKEEGFHDKRLILKVATGQAGNYSRIDEKELTAIRAYLHQISFAGTRASVVSRNGDVLIPRVTAYYDGSVEAGEVYKEIENSLNTFIESIEFDGVVYVQKIIDAIQRAKYVTDVFVDTSNQQGIFVAQYDDSNRLITVQGSAEHSDVEHRVSRFFVPNGGFVKQSSKEGDEALLPMWRESIVLKIDGQ